MNGNPQKARLSLCMIVKNEEEFLGDCLNSVKGLADQLVIVDTGSTDKTLQIAETFGAEIHHFKWCDDFAAARNASLGYARCKWVLWMDADERLRPECRETLINCLKNYTKPVLYTVSIRSITDGGKNYHDSDAHRLFTRHPAIRFEGIIHEQISYSARKAGAKEMESGIILDHVGYDLDEDSQKKKLLRNQPLIEKMVAADDRNAYAHFWLAQNLSQQNKPQEALKYMERSLALERFTPSFRASALNITAQLYTRVGEWQKAVKYARESLQLFTMQFGAEYILYLAAEHEGKTTEAIVHLETLIKNTRYLLRNPKKISTDTLAPVADLLGALGKQYYISGDHHKALEKFLEARKEAGDDRHLKEIIALAQTENNLRVLSETLTESIAMGNQSAESFDTLGITQIKQKRFEEALETYELLMQRLPENPYVAKRTASLYAKLGDLEKAERILVHLAQQN